jgi:hypothetical protein
LILRGEQGGIEQALRMKVVLGRDVVVGIADRDVLMTDRGLGYIR